MHPFRLAPQIAPARPADRRGVFGWMLYDWANQPFQTLIVTFIFAPYFAAEVIGDPVRGQALWGMAAAIGGATVALLAPLVGAVADRTGARKPWVLAFSVPYVVGCLGFWLAVPGMADPRAVLVAYFLAFIGSEFGQIATNAMLPDLGPRREIGRISGSGWALGYLGGLVSLVVVLALLAPAPGSERTLIGLAPLFGLDPAAGEPARATGPLSALWYAVFALPLFLWTPDVPRRPAAGALRAGLADLAATLRQVRRHASLFTFLIASMVYRDALAALFTFGGIYAAGVLAWGLFQLGVFGIVAAGVGTIGAWLGGRADRAFGPRPVIVASIWCLMAVCAVALLTTRDSVLLLPVAADSRLPDLVFMAAGGLLGAAAGSLQAASRTLLVHQAEGRVAPAQAFGLYALSGKATAFLGPALIAVATATTGSQRLGVSPVILLFLVGLGLLCWVKTDTEQSMEIPA
jgi:MFS transporter, UMF1 family